MRVWAEINLDNLKHNIKKIKEFIGNKKIMGVIKADAYGHGAPELAKALVKEGIDILGVATMDEAVELRMDNIDSKILVLGPVLEEEWEKAEKYDVSIPVGTMDEIIKLEERKIKLRVHIAIDTGMGRIGFSVEEGMKALKHIKNNEVLEIEGVFSHLSSADMDREYTMMQLKKFEEFEKENIEYIHILNSAGSVLYADDTLSSHVRPGLMLYGIMPYEGENFLKPLLTLKSRVIFLKKLEEESYISYQKNYFAKKGELIATIGIGYGDGFSRSFSNRGRVVINGVECPIVGNICMDQMMVSVPMEAGRVEVGDEVIIYGEDYNEKAKEIDTIAYELLTSINKRVERIYIKNGKTVGRKNLIMREWYEAD